MADADSRHVEVNDKARAAYVDLVESQAKRKEGVNEANMTFGLISHQRSVHKGSMVTQNSESAKSSGQKGPSFLIQATQRSLHSLREAQVGAMPQATASQSAIGSNLLAREEAKG